MKTFEIRVKSVKDVLDDFERTFEALRSGKPALRREGVFFTSLEAARNLLTPERLKLIALIRKEKPSSIYELAKMAGRDLKNVHEDVRLLERHGILQTDLDETDARTRRVPDVPYDEIKVTIRLGEVSELSPSYPSVDRSSYEVARSKYLPKRIRYLLVAESPPRDPRRFFYFENVWKADNLFLETMKVLYPSEAFTAKLIRSKKAQFLRRFKADGFFLLDAIELPLGQIGRSRKVGRIRDSLPILLRRIKDLLGGQDAKVILISGSVYEALAHSLKENGLEVANDGPINFPAQGHQRLYREQLKTTLEKSGWVPSGWSQKG